MELPIIEAVGWEGFEEDRADEADLFDVAPALLRGGDTEMRSHLLLVLGLVIPVE